MGKFEVGDEVISLYRSNSRLDSIYHKVTYGKIYKIIFINDPWLGIKNDYYDEYLLLENLAIKNTRLNRVLYCE